MPSRELSDDEIDAFLRTPNGRQLASMLTYTAVGTPDEVGEYLTTFAKDAQADELIVAHQSTRIDDRLRSVALTAKAAIA